MPEQPSPDRRGKEEQGADHTEPSWRDALVPFRQGQLDQLCGVYAIINGLRWVHGADLITDGVAEELFWVLTEHAIKELGRLSICTAGLGSRAECDLAQLAADTLAEEYEVRSRVGVLPVLGMQAQIEDLRRFDRSKESETSAMLLLLRGRHQHWSVYRSLDGGTLNLFDSAGKDRLLLEGSRVASRLVIRR